MRRLDERAVRLLLGRPGRAKRFIYDRRGYGNRNGLCADVGAVAAPEVVLQAGDQFGFEGIALNRESGDT